MIRRLLGTLILESQRDVFASVFQGMHILFVVLRKTNYNRR
jgi:hypothetical protein